MDEKEEHSVLCGLFTYVYELFKTCIIYSKLLFKMWILLAILSWKGKF